MFGYAPFDGGPVKGGGQVNGSRIAGGGLGGASDGCCWITRDGSNVGGALNLATSSFARREFRFSLASPRSASSFEISTTWLTMASRSWSGCNETSFMKMRPQRGHCGFTNGIEVGASCF